MREWDQLLKEIWRSVKKEKKDWDPFNPYDPIQTRSCSVEL